MPRINFFRLTCQHCHTEYKVRIERIASGEPVECLTCGYQIDITGPRELLNLVAEYSNLVLQLERHFRLEGDTAMGVRSG